MAAVTTLPYVIAALAAGNQPASDLDANYNALAAAIAEFNTFPNYLIDTGAANAYVVTLGAGLTGALTDGLMIQMKAVHVNTAASTLNYNATGALPITLPSGGAIPAGAIPAAAIIILIYSSGTASWLLVSGNVSVFTTPTFIGAVTEDKRAIAYRYTGWDPSDLIGSTTNAAATATATITAADYLTFANSGGTLTITCVKTGSYLVTVAMQNEMATSLQTDGNTVAGFFVLGGTGTLLWPTTTTLIGPVAFTGGDYNNSNLGGGCSFMVSLTAVGQTVTILPKISVTSGAGATTDYTTQCTVTASYQGVN